MSDLRTRVGQAVTRQRTPVRRTLWAALVFSFLVLVLTTHVKVFRPAWEGVVQAHQLYVAKQERVALEQENARLRDILHYLQTPAGRDLAVRGKVYAIKPGERLIVVRETAKPAPPPPPTWVERLWGTLERGRASAGAGGRLLVFIGRALVGKADAPTKDNTLKSGVKKTAAVMTK